MDAEFDLRLDQGRQSLATFLPHLDGRTLQVPPEEFVKGLERLAHFLGKPDWLTYQYGMVGPVLIGNVRHPFDLAEMVELGLELDELSRHDNFAALLSGFGHFAQFLDTVFETHTASFFSRLELTKGLRFAPEHEVRGHLKRPEFDVVTADEIFSVECKRPNQFVQDAAITFNDTVDRIHDELRAADWPQDVRMEVLLTRGVRGSPSALAKRIVRRGLSARESGEAQFVEGPSLVFLVPMNAEFQIESPRFGHDVMTVDDEPTGLFNPRKTYLRVAHQNLDRRFASSAGARIAEALRQLPTKQRGIIALGGIPRRIAQEAIHPRLEDAAYDNILAFVVHEDHNFHFVYRSGDRGAVQNLVGRGPRPLFVPIHLSGPNNDGAQHPPSDSTR